MVYGTFHPICLDRDECVSSNDTCEAVCVNIPGSYICLCKDGHQQINQACPGIYNILKQFIIRNVEFKTLNKSECAQKICHLKDPQRGEFRNSISPFLKF